MDQDTLIDRAQQNLERFGIEVTTPDQVINRTDDSDQPKAVYTPQFDRLDLYNMSQSDDETVIQVEHELLHKHQYEKYGQQDRHEEAMPDMDLQRPSQAAGRSELDPTEPEQRSASIRMEHQQDRLIKTMGEAVALIYTAFRRDELDDDTVQDMVQTLQGRGTYQGQKTAAMLQDLYDRFRNLSGDDEGRMEDFLTTVQDDCFQ
ncbi:MAG: hypothetical protein SV186_01655 [Candidatus Nanohaloarchaea archaeon]|nr:hypothetical protein [Candidatus Nanohaloarchaea archaeon]